MRSVMLAYLPEFHLHWPVFFNVTSIGLNQFMLSHGHLDHRTLFGSCIYKYTVVMRGIIAAIGAYRVREKWHRDVSACVSTLSSL